MNIMNNRRIRLGVNIDHIATIRNARGGAHPSPVLGAMIAQKCGADGITLHLREDRRHIRDEDLSSIAEAIKLPINLEMAPTEEMLEIAIKFKPNAVCIVPEKRQEITTEGGLDVIRNSNKLAKIITKLKQHNILVSIFVEANKEQILKCKELGANIVELHSGRFCELHQINQSTEEYHKIEDCAKMAVSIGLECHLGHGLNYETAQILANIKEISEFNIGHFIIGEAIIEGLGIVIEKMNNVINKTT